MYPSPGVVSTNVYAGNVYDPSPALFRAAIAEVEGFLLTTHGADLLWVLQVDVAAAIGAAGKIRVHRSVSGLAERLVGRDHVARHMLITEHGQDFLGVERRPRIDPLCRITDLSSKARNARA